MSTDISPPPPRELQLPPVSGVAVGVALSTCSWGGGWIAAGSAVGAVGTEVAAGMAVAGGWVGATATGTIAVGGTVVGDAVGAIVGAGADPAAGVGV